jgi:hypothetical protein
MRQNIGLAARYDVFKALSHPNLDMPNAPIAPNGSSSIVDIIAMLPVLFGVVRALETVSS